MCKNASAIDALIMAQVKRYPHLMIQDIVKALYQSEFGCGHFVTDNAEGYQWLLDEEKECTHAQREAEPPFIEPLGEKFSRAYLSGLRKSGLSVQTLYKLFVLSGQVETGNLAAFSSYLDRINALCASGELQLDGNDTQRFLAEYKAQGCPATHHSPRFRQAYAPAYRVVLSSLCPWIPVLAAVDAFMARQSITTVAIEGGSASGKTMLASFLHAVYHCNVFHMDDFFLRPHQRTASRLAEPGGNVDYERFKETVLDPVFVGVPFHYQAYDCMTQTLQEAVQVDPKPLNIIEGAYSMHPTLAPVIDFSIFLTIDENTQRERILRRNGSEMQKRFQDIWIPLEKSYFDQTRTAARCTMTMDGTSVPFIR